MTNHHLSVEQRFHLEAAFREIDACQDLEKLREVTKQIITAQENEKAFAREAMSQLRKEMEFAASKKFGFNWLSTILRRALSKFILCSLFKLRSEYLLNLMWLENAWKFDKKFIFSFYSVDWLLQVQYQCVITLGLWMYGYFGAMAEWLCRGLQILVYRFDSGSRLHFQEKLKFFLFFWNFLWSFYYGFAIQTKLILSSPIIPR